MEKGRQTGGWHVEVLKDTPFLLSGGGSRNKFYERIKEGLRLRLNPKPLVLPLNTACRVHHYRQQCAQTCRISRISLANEALGPQKTVDVSMGASGMFSVPPVIVISGINIMAKKESEMASKELAARELLAYSEF